MWGASCSTELGGSQPPLSVPQLFWLFSWLSGGVSEFHPQGRHLLENGQ